MTAVAYDAVMAAHRRRVALGRWLAIAAWLIAVSSAAANDGCIDPTRLPELTLQLTIRNGSLAVDRTKSGLDLRGHEAQFLGRSEAQWQQELLDYADRVLASRGSLLRQLVLSTDAESTLPSAARIAEVDARLAEHALRNSGTARLVAQSLDWGDAQAVYPPWAKALDSQGLPWARGEGTLSAVWTRVARHAFVDGPLLGMDLREVDSELDQQRQQRRHRGILSFVVAPPFVADAEARKLRPMANPQQWERLRPGLADDVLAPFNGQLWHRDQLLSRLQDYMALRGVELKAWRRHDEQDVLCGVVVEESEPKGHPGVVPMRPRAGQTSGSGRVLLGSDPLPAAVYIVAGPTQRDLAMRVLYLLLPSEDFRRLRADPARYLEGVREDWLLKPDGSDRAEAWRMRVDEGPGRELRFAGMLMTRRALAERLQRLALLDYQARIDRVVDVIPARRSSENDRELARRREGFLIAEPVHVPLDAATPQPPGDKREGTLDVSELGDVAAPKPLAEAARVPSRRRHHLKLGVEHRSGKPLRGFGSFHRDGVSDDDTVAVEFGHNGQLQGSAAYERDFVGFDTIGRRLQLSARVYSDFSPDRVVEAQRADVRRTGAEVSGVIDLWRDWRDSFGQAEIGLSRQRNETFVRGTTTGDDVTWLRRVDLSLTLARSQPGTAAAAHDAVIVSTSLAQGDAGSFRRGSIALHRHQFIGFFDRLDLRFYARGVSSRAPPAEWPSFGGEESVRGLREDLATGRSLWALQSEWWMPVPWKTDNERLASLLRRQIALAAWVDTGAIHRPTTAIERRHTVIGLGLRYSQSDELTMRLDVARPVAGVAADQRRLRVLFTVSARPRL